MEILINFILGITIASYIVVGSLIIKKVVYKLMSEIKAL